MSGQEQLRSPSSDPRITPAMEDYLKAIYNLQVNGEPVTNQQLAEELGYSGASITNMQKRLHELKLLTLEPYKGVRLTPAGTAVALEVIRHHRLLELFLAQSLGMDLDAVHDEADRLEHHVSEELEALIAAALGFPEFDPHGDPIPTPDLKLPELDDVELSKAVDQHRVVVTRVSDKSAEVVRLLVASGIVPGVEVCGISRVAENDGVIVKLCGGRSVAISPESAGAVRVRALN